MADPVHVALLYLRFKLPPSVMICRSDVHTNRSVTYLQKWSRVATKTICKYCESLRRTAPPNSGKQSPTQVRLFILSPGSNLHCLIFWLNNILSYKMRDTVPYLPEDHLSLNARHLVQLFGSIRDRRKAYGIKFMKYARSFRWKETI